MINRRSFSIGLLATPFIGSPAVAATCGRVQDQFRPTQNAKFSAWVDRFASRAASHGIRNKTLKAGFRNGGYLPDVVRRDRSQFQTRRTLEDYLAIATSNDRLAKGAKAIKPNANVLAAIEQTYGVDRYIVAAIWGIESRFGERRGDVPVVSATATLAFDGRRGAFFESQLVTALKILQRGDVDPENLTGSWAGAMGHTQFIPTSYWAFAVDYNRDGRRNIWSNDPTDALASTASYLARNGWRKGLPWGGEAGVTRAKGNVIQPQSGGPSFVTTSNFKAILRYNNSPKYALSVGHLADRLRGLGPLRGDFPKDGFGMSHAERTELQRRLKRKGYDLGEADGVIGSKTTCAIQNFQTRRGMDPTGRPSLSLLKKL